ncbi:MAG: hypothetical protein CMF63_05865 [Magnetovibrio sp.]|jgi:uncharacterized membrane protein YgdD (TMEM256/DUF423 family)|nr:hypothetical protein [Magnetovibrio sp.]
MRIWLFLGGLNGLLAVAAGAYGWHWLEVSNPVIRDTFLMGSDYQMWHALALLAVAWLASRRTAESGESGRQGSGAIAIRIAGLAFAIGIVLFSGSLYAIGLIGTIPDINAAPAGGVCLIIGWAALIWAAVVRA